MTDEITRLRRANAKLKEALALALYYVEGDSTWEAVKLKTDKLVAQADAIMHQPETSRNQPDVGFFAEQYGPSEDSDK